MIERGWPAGSAWRQPGGLALRGAGGDGITIIPSGEDARRLGPAPLALLDLDPRMIARFSRWGIRTLGELADLPSRGLAERLGDEGAWLQRLARGEDTTPLRLWTPPPVFEESAECSWDVETLEPLADLAAGLAEILCARLSQHGCSADAFEWSCRLADRTMHEERLRARRAASDPAAAAALVRSSLAAHPPRTAVRRSPSGRVRARGHHAAALRRAAAPQPAPGGHLARLSALVDARGIGSRSFSTPIAPTPIRWRRSPFPLPSGEQGRGEAVGPR
jgi:hypothetical protein